MKAYKVVTTTDGKTLHSFTPGAKTEDRLSKEIAENMAESANKRAESMGLKVRYEVKPL